MTSPARTIVDCAGSDPKGIAGMVEQAAVLALLDVLAIDQVLDDLAQLRLLGAGTVVLDPFSGHPGETRRPEAAWQALATVWAGTRHLEGQP